MPLRTALSPAAFGPLLPQIFVLGQDGGTERVRLAGGLVADLHGGELRGAEFGALWAQADRSRLHAALAEARRLARPVVLHAEGLTADGADLGLEVLLCPLIGPTAQVDRTIGLYQPTTLTARLAGRPLERLHLIAVEACTDPMEAFSPLPFPPAVSARTALKLVVDNTRRVA